jgi:hypothetical protein
VTGAVDGGRRGEMRTVIDGGDWDRRRAVAKINGLFGCAGWGQDGACFWKSVML